MLRASCPISRPLHRHLLGLIRRDSGLPSPPLLSRRCSLSAPPPSALFQSLAGASGASTASLPSRLLLKPMLRSSGALMAAAVSSVGLSTSAADQASDPTPPEEPTCRRCTITRVSGEVAEHLSDVLLSFGAQSVTVQEHRPPGAPEQQIYADAGQDQLWDSCDLVAHFALEHDIAETMSIASAVLHDLSSPEGEAAEAGASGKDGAVAQLQYVVQDVPNTAWVDQIKASYVPLRISDTLYIIPEWSQPLDLSAVNVILQPGVAFGTGEHPTTRLCLQFLERHIPHLLAVRSTSTSGSTASTSSSASTITSTTSTSGSSTNGGGSSGISIIDYGTGSGVLAIAALLLGAARAAGTDVDPLSVRAATRNAELNGVEGRLTVVRCRAGRDSEEPLEQAGQAAGQQFDVCVANILRGPLVELCPRLGAYVKPGGMLALSGILEVQAADVCTAYGAEFEDFNVRTDSGWAVITATKKAAAHSA